MPEGPTLVKMPNNKMAPTHVNIWRGEQAWLLEYPDELDGTSYCAAFRFSEWAKTWAEKHAGINKWELQPNRKGWLGTKG